MVKNDNNDWWGSQGIWQIPAVKNDWLKALQQNTSNQLDTINPLEDDTCRLY